MDTLNFCYWLQGFAEIHGGLPDEKQWEEIKNHLKLALNTEPKTAIVWPFPQKSNPSFPTITYCGPIPKDGETIDCAPFIPFSAPISC
jgi:hypothetical protein